MYQVSIAAVQGPLGPVAGRLNAIGAITGRVSLKLLIALAAFTALVLVLQNLFKQVQKLSHNYLN